jgi:putative addiction module component (TIGR02574 family)
LSRSKPLAPTARYNWIIAFFNDDEAIDMTVEAITSAALALPEESRIELVETLLRSLNDSVSAKYWAEWEVEIADRIAAYDRGEMQSYSREEVMRFLDQDADS